MIFLTFTYKYDPTPWYLRKNFMAFVQIFHSKRFNNIYQLSKNKPKVGACGKEEGK